MKLHIISMAKRMSVSFVCICSLYMLIGGILVVSDAMGFNNWFYNLTSHAVYASDIFFLLVPYVFLKVFEMIKLAFVLSVISALAYECRRIRPIKDIMRMSIRKFNCCKE